MLLDKVMYHIHVEGGIDSVLKCKFQSTACHYDLGQEAMKKLQSWNCLLQHQIIICMHSFHSYLPPKIHSPFFLLVINFQNLGISSNPKKDLTFHVVYPPCLCFLFLFFLKEFYALNYLAWNQPAQLAQLQECWFANWLFGAERALYIRELAGGN